MQSNPTILFAVVCGFFLILFGMVTVIVMAARSANARMEKISKALGMTPLTDHQRLLEKLTYVNNVNRPERYSLLYAFQRHSSSGGDVYLFSMGHHDRTATAHIGRKRSGKNGYHLVESNALAFVSPLWNLPRFQAMPRMEGEGFFANLANKAAEGLAEIKMDVIKFQHIPNLADRYLIATPEIPAAQVNPPDEFLRALAANPGLILHAGGDTMTISYSGTINNQPDEERMKALYKIGIQLAKDIQSR